MDKITGNRFTGESERRLDLVHKQEEILYFDSIDVMIAFAIDKKLLTASKIKHYSRRQRAKFVKDNAKLLHWGGKRFKPGFEQTYLSALNHCWDQRRKYRVFPKIGKRPNPVTDLLARIYDY